MQHYDIIIVGGGPTGAALGIELGLNNIKTLILEKHVAPLLSPRAQGINARSVEFFMRWGIEHELKSKQLLTEEFPNQGIWCSKLTGKTYAVASSNEQLNDKMTPQRGIRVPLWLTEEVLRDRLQQFSSITFLKEHPVIDIQFNKENIIVTAKNKSEETLQFSASYVVGCDGANSITRKKAEIKFEELAPPQRTVSVLFESPDLAKKITVEKGFLFYLLESERPGAIGPVDPAHGLWYAGMRGDDLPDNIEEVDVGELLQQMTGMDFSKKIVKAHYWNMHVQLAEHFAKDNRIFLVGDSAHGFVPTGGFGLNTGFGDVVNIGWKLAEVIKKQAKPSLLETYEPERLPVCVNNLLAAKKNAEGMMGIRKKYDPMQNPEEFAKANAELAKQFVSATNLIFGYAFLESPLTLLQKDQTTDTSSDTSYHPKALPGHYLPHIWLEKNKSIYAVLSPTHWTLIISGEGNAESIKQWQKAFDQHKLKLEILPVPANSYAFQYVLIRPDWQIAFSGNELTNDYVERLATF